MSDTPARVPAYNELAGSNVARLAAISDGIFAVGMTLLVLGLAVPAVSSVKTEGDLLHQLSNLLPEFITYFMSFLTLGIFWVGQQTGLSEVTRSDRNYTWIQLGFLLAVTLVPFTTNLLAHYDWSRVALVIYWLNIVVMGFALLASTEYGLRAGLFPDDRRQLIARLVRRRVYWAQALYLIAALFAIVDTHWSIALIVAIQLNFVIAPRIPLLHRI